MVKKALIVCVVLCANCAGAHGMRWERAASWALHTVGAIAHTSAQVVK